MKDFKYEIVKRGIESLVIRIFAEKDGETISKDINLGGNATSAALWGVHQVIEALKEMESDNG